jgi:hypothetical protein
MKIGVIGAGTVGSSLGTAWAKNGHTVMYGVRDPNSDKVQKAVSAGGAVLVGTLVEAAEFSDVIVLSVPWAPCRKHWRRWAIWAAKCWWMSSMLFRHRQSNMVLSVMMWQPGRKTREWSKPLIRWALKPCPTRILTGRKLPHSSLGIMSKQKRPSSNWRMTLAWMGSMLARWRTRFTWKA